MTLPFSSLEIPIAPQPDRLDLETCFNNCHPLEVDIGSGKGRFLLARAAAYPDVNFIGIERQRRRVEKVAKKAFRTGLQNIRLIRTEIRFALELLIPDHAVRTFYIFYPDPWPKRRHHCRRLINSEFLSLLHRKLQPNGRVHFATDHLDYFSAATPLFEASPLFTACQVFNPTEDEQTDFELLFASQGKHANRCSFCVSTLDPEESSPIQSQRKDARS